MAMSVKFLRNYTRCTLLIVDCKAASFRQTLHRCSSRSGIFIPHTRWWWTVGRKVEQKSQRWRPTWWHTRSQRSNTRFRTGKPPPVCRWLWCLTWSWPWGTWRLAALSSAAHPAGTQPCWCPCGHGGPERGRALLPLKWSLQKRHNPTQKKWAPCPLSRPWFPPYPLTS